MMKATKEQIKTGKELAGNYGFKRIWVNKKGEFFSNENYCANSVSSKKDEYAEVPLTVVVDEEKGTNDLETAKEVIAHIEVAATADAVEAILKAEKEGKNRVTVIEAADKKLKSLTEKGSK